MARDYGRIRSQFWNHPDVKQWPLELKGFASYLMTCEHATALGAFRLPAAYISDDLDIAPSKAREMLADLEARDFVKVCPASGWIWIVNYIRHNKPEAGNVWKHVVGLAQSMPSNFKYRSEVLKSLADQPSEAASKALPSESEPASNKEPISTEPLSTEPNSCQKPPAKRAKGDYPEDFLAFWQAYPHPANPGGKSTAFKAWQGIGDFPAELLACVEAYKRSVDAENANKRPDNRTAYCMAVTWLNQRRWEPYLDAIRAEATKAAEAEAKRYSGLPECWKAPAERYAEAHGWPAWDAAVTSVRLFDGDPPGIEFDRPWARQFAEERGVLERLERAIGQRPRVTIRESRAA